MFYLWCLACFVRSIDNLFANKQWSYYVDLKGYAIIHSRASRNEATRFPTIWKTCPNFRTCCNYRRKYLLRFLTRTDSWRIGASTFTLWQQLDCKPYVDPANSSESKATSTNWWRLSSVRRLLESAFVWGSSTGYLLYLSVVPVLTTSSRKGRTICTTHVLLWYR